MFEMPGRLLAASLILSSVPGCVTAPPPASMVPASMVEVTTACSALPGMASACGPRGAEDLMAVPGGRWLLASGMNLGGQGGHLYWIDRTSGRSFVAWPGGVKLGEATCGAPGAEMSITGLTIDGNRLLAVNGGGRKAIELFDITGGASNHPLLRWADCVPLAADTSPNSVARMGDGTLVVTSFLEPGASDPWGTLETGAPLGRVLTAGPDGAWRAAFAPEPDWAWRTLDLGPLSGPNGLTTAADGKTLYLSEWGASRVLVVEGLASVTRRIPLPFRPDNIHLLPDGKLLVAGQQGSPSAIGRCGAQCPLRWFVARVDPASGAVEVLMDRTGSEQANYATAALPIDGKIYIAVRGDNRVLILDQSK
ncbi:MAG: hypothetical protein WA842_07775 [Croceibacterium sp.]